MQREIYLISHIGLFICCVNVYKICMSCYLLPPITIVDGWMEWDHFAGEGIRQLATERPPSPPLLR